jgi:hypothetical protein
MGFTLYVIHFTFLIKNLSNYLVVIRDSGIRDWGIKFTNNEFRTPNPEFPIPNPD